MRPLLALAAALLCASALPAVAEPRPAAGRSAVLAPHARFGTRSFRELLAPAIEYAERGAPVPAVIARFWQSEQALLRKSPDAARTFLPGGRAPRAGEVSRNPALARTFREIAAHGR